VVEVALEGVVWEVTVLVQDQVVIVYALPVGQRWLIPEEFPAISKNVRNAVHRWLESSGKEVVKETTPCTNT